MELIIDEIPQEPGKVFAGIYPAEWHNPEAKELVLKMHSVPMWILIDGAHYTKEPLKVWAVRIRATTSAS